MRGYEIILLYLEAIQRKGSPTNDIAAYSVLLSASSTAHLFTIRGDKKGEFKVTLGIRLAFHYIVESSTFYLF